MIHDLLTTLSPIIFASSSSRDACFSFAKESFRKRLVEKKRVKSRLVIRRTRYFKRLWHEQFSFVFYTITYSLNYKRFNMISNMEKGLKIWFVWKWNICQTYYLQTIRGGIVANWLLLQVLIESAYLVLKHVINYSRENIHYPLIIIIRFPNH